MGTRIKRHRDSVRDLANAQRINHAYKGREADKHCPGCTLVFRGVGAEKRYKDHWKDTHAKKEIKIEKEVKETKEKAT